MRVEYLASNDPFENAAFEERIYRGQRLGGEATLLFYTNRESVLLGRNQEPSRECDLAWCESEGVPVLRRVSGGGTVWHDLGNQNYAFIMPRAPTTPRESSQSLWMRFAWSASRTHSSADASASGMATTRFQEARLRFQGRGRCSTDASPSQATSPDYRGRW